jgi:hypothetical protein
MTGWQLVIEREYTRDLVVIDLDNHGAEIGWSCMPQVPDRRDGWQIFDSSSDDKTGWRRISLAWDGGVP